MIELTPDFIERYVAAERRESIALSRQLTPDQKMRMGPILYERECEIVKRIILHAFPNASEEVVVDLIRQVMRWYHDSD